MASASSLIQSTMVLALVAGGTWCFAERYISQSAWSESRNEFEAVPSELEGLPEEAGHAGSVLTHAWYRVSTRIDTDGLYLLKELLAAEALVKRNVQHLRGEPVVSGLTPETQRPGPDLAGR